MNIRKLRKEKNLTQEELAEIVNVTKATINSYELGRTEPNIDILIKLADYYNVTLDYLVGRENENLLTKYFNEKKQLLKIAEQLNKDNLLKVLIYATGLLDGQN